MADDLSKLIHDLNSASDASSKLNARLVEIEQTLARVIKASASGKVTPEGLDKAVNRTLAGGNISGMGLGGGRATRSESTLLSLKRLQEEHVKTSLALNEATSLLQYYKLRDEAVSLLRSRITAPTTRTPTPFDAGPTGTGRGVLKPFDPTDIIKKFETVLAKLPTATVAKINTDVTKTAIEFGKWENPVKVADIRVRSLSSDLKEISTLVTGIGKQQLLKWYTDKSGNLTSLEKGLRSQATGPISKLTGITEEARAKAAANIKTLPFDAKATESMATSVKVLDNNLIKLTTTITEVSGAQSKYNQFIVGGSRVLTEEALQAEIAAKKLQAMKSAISERLTPAAAQKLYSIAGKRGFAETDLKALRTEEPTGITRVQFEQYDKAANAMRTMTVGFNRYGDVVNITNRRLQNFTESIIRNTSELIKWSIGIGIVYGSYYKLQQLIKLAIENQTKLADIAVTLGNAQRAVNAVFEDAALVADQTGESITNVLDTYTMAYRAVGEIKDPIERAASANKLLSDATILNKLSGLDAAESIDVLSAALRQAQTYYEGLTGTQLEGAKVFEMGTDMLDKWVKLTRVANVDLATLATAFSVTAESGLNAGMSIEELNATIASLSAKIGGLGGKETGNAVRALIGGVYQQQAAVALQNYGIAVQDTEGRMRNFLDISKDIYELYRAGIIDETQLNKLAYVLGGGVRRGQQYVAFLKDVNKVQELAIEQQNAQGSAAAALGIKIETLQTAVTKLSNSFQVLAQTLGTTGGILSTMTGLTELLTSAVGLVNSLAAGLGNLAVPAALTTAILLYSQIGTGGLKLLTAKRKMFGWADTLAAGAGGIGATRPLSPESGWQAATVPMSSKNIASNAVMGAVMAMYPAMQRFMQAGQMEAGSKQRAAQTKAGFADAGGAIAGGIAGALIGGPAGALIGGQIGAFIAEKFVSETLTYEGQFENFFKDIFPKPGEIPEIITDEATRKREKATGYALETAGTGLSKTVAGIANFIGSISMRKDITSLSGMAPAKFNVTPEQAALYILSISDPEAYAEAVRLLQEARLANPLEVPEKERTFYKQQAIYGAETETFMKEYAASYRKKLLAEEMTGKISAKEYREGVTKTYALAPDVTRLYTSMSIIGKTGGISKMQQDYEEFSNLLMQSSAEDVSVIVSLVGEIEDLSAVIDKLKKGGEGTTTEFKDEMINTAQATELLNKKGQELLDTINAINLANKQASMGKIKLYEVFDMSKYTKEQARAVESRAKEMQRKALLEQVKQGAITAEEMEMLIAMAEPILIDLGEKMGSDLAKGITDSNFLQKGLDELIASGQIPDLSDLDLGLQFMSDTTMAQLNAAMAKYPAMVASINAAAAAKGFPSPVNEQPSLVFPKDATDPIYMKADWQIVQYLLGEILKTEEKQLDGMYNLPSGASFYVPYQAWAMDTETRQAAAQGQAQPSGPVSLDDTQFQSSVGNFDTAVNTLLQGIEKFYASLNPDLDMELDKAFNEKFRQERGLTDKNKDWGMRMYYGALNPRIDAALNARDQFKQYGLAPTYGGPGGEKLLSPITQPLGGPGGERAPSRLDQYGRPLTGPGGEVPVTPAEPTNFETFLNTLNSLFEGLKTSLGFGNVGAGVGLGVVPAPVPAPTTTTEAPAVSTTLNLNIQTQTQLIVDGRTLADVIKPYLEQDIVTSEGSMGSTTTYQFA